LKKFKEGDADVRLSILQINTYRLGPIAQPLRAAGLQDKDERVLGQAILFLKGKAESYLPLLVPHIKHKSVKIRTQLIPLFQSAGENGVPHLGEMLQDSEDEIRL